MKKLLCMLALAALVTAGLSAQTEADFEVGLTEDSEGVVIKKYTGKAPQVRIPATIQGMPVRIIGERAFYGGNYGIALKITGVVIPEGVTEIRKEAFSEQDKLTAVTLPSTLTVIGKGAFVGCTALRSIVIPEGVTKIEHGAFQATSLTSVKLPPGLTVINEGLFASCKNLSSVTIPEGVTHIGVSAFTNCTALTAITLPASIQSIDNGAFTGCSALTTITIPETVQKIKFRGNIFGGGVKLPLATQAALKKLGYGGGF
jgi:hypothetical protein